MEEAPGTLDVEARRRTLAEKGFGEAPPSRPGFRARYKEATEGMAIASANVFGEGGLDVAADLIVDHEFFGKT